MTGQARRPATPRPRRHVQRKDVGAQRPDGPDVLLPPLPVGRLHDRTLRLIAVAGRVHVRSGPWIPIEEDESRVVRITGVDDLLFGRPAATDEEPERRRRSEARRAIRQVVGARRRSRRSRRRRARAR